MSGRLKNIPTGYKKNRWTVLDKVVRKDNKTFYLCRCDCGKEKFVSRGSLMNGGSKSCGCWKREVDIARHYTHGQSFNRIYSVWKNMRKRCNDPKHKAYEYYGGKGVSVYKEWNDSFDKFWNWAKENGYTPQLELDRINFDGNYEPDNCRFVDRIEQMRNRKCTRFVNAFGERKTLREWSYDPRCVVKKDTLRNRIYSYGWDGERALITKVK